MNRERQFFETANFARPFDERPRDLRKIGPQQRLAEREALIVLSGRHDDWRAGFARVVEHSHRVAESRRNVDADARQFSRRLRVAVGHRHHGCFLQPENVAQLRFDRERIHQRQLRRSGISEDILDAFLLQKLEKRAFS